MHAYVHTHTHTHTHTFPTGFYYRTETVTAIQKVLVSKEKQTDTGRLCAHLKEGRWSEF